MKPIHFKEVNTVHTKPEGMSEEQCGDLPTYTHVGPHGEVTNISCWEFTPEDLKELNETGKLWLFVSSPTLPPIGMNTANPFKSLENE